MVLRFTSPLRRRLSLRHMLIGASVAAVVLVAATTDARVVSAGAATTTSKAVTCKSSPLSSAEPSLQAPPKARSLPGYAMAYCNDFRGSSLPAGWGKFDGVPQGDPSGRFEPSHVAVSSGILALGAWQDPAHGNVWATGGVCHCGKSRTYGAYFVRSRVTGPGPDEVELLWPVKRMWPPEIDFNESAYEPTTSMWTIHYSAANQVVTRTIKIDLTKWHTWGVFWTKTFVAFTVDGFIWGSTKSASAIPRQAMTLDIQQQSYCGIAPECPTKPTFMYVDWVAEFSPK